MPPERIGTTRNPENIARRIWQFITGNWRHSRYVPDKFPPLGVQRAAYANRLQKSLKANGIAEKVEVTVERCLLTRATFEIADFAHEGKVLYVLPDNEENRRSPAAVAREICAEIADHRNFCKECGIGIPSIHWRAAGYASIYSPRMRMDAPPDAVEQKLFPRISKRLLARLAQHPRQDEQSEPIQAENGVWVAGVI